MLSVLGKIFGRVQQKSENKGHLKERILADKSLGNDEKQLVSRFVDTVLSTVEDVIIPRSDIRGVQETADFFETLKLFGDIGSTQIIVYQDSLDKIVGYVDISDVVGYIDRPYEFAIELIKKDIPFVVPNMKIMDAVKQMQMTGCRHLVVVDEFGGVDGMISMDKVIGEVFEVFFNNSTLNTLILPTGVPNEFLVDARAPIDLCEEHFKAKLLLPIDGNDDVPDIETLGGLITAIFGKVPSVGDVIDHKSGMQFVIKDANLRRVLKVLVKTNDANSGK